MYTYTLNSYLHSTVNEGAYIARDAITLNDNKIFLVSFLIQDTRLLPPN